MFTTERQKSQGILLDCEPHQKPNDIEWSYLEQNDAQKAEISRR